MNSLQAAEQIQDPGPHVHQDVLIGLNNGRESFRRGLATQLFGMRDVHGQLDQGMHQCALAVDTKLVTKRPEKRHATRND